MSSIYDSEGRRKYLTEEEQGAVLNAAHESVAPVKTFCVSLALTGARVSELLALTPRSIELDEQLIIIESLKKRSHGIYRAIPIPRYHIDLLQDVHHFDPSQSCPARQSFRLWPWCRTTAWKRVRDVMLRAGIPSPRANPRALRHTFAVAALRHGIPLNMVQKWLGHSRMSTTAIYTEITGPDEREFADRLWNSDVFAIYARTSD